MPPNGTSARGHCSTYFPCAIGCRGTLAARAHLCTPPRLNDGNLGTIGVRHIRPREYQVRSILRPRQEGGVGPIARSRVAGAGGGKGGPLLGRSPPSPFRSHSRAL